MHVDGAVQKGPFLVGSTILINRRDQRGFSTASTILSEIEDSIGSFDFVTTDPGLVQIVATGYYFSELTGQVSNGTLTLRALYKITDQPGQKAYVNIMTHLINDRVLALLAAGNIDTASAIAKAEIRARQSISRRAARAKRRRVLRLERLQHRAAPREPESGTLICSHYRRAFTNTPRRKQRSSAQRPTPSSHSFSTRFPTISRLTATSTRRDSSASSRRRIRRLSPETIVDNLRGRAIVDYPAGLDVPDISVFLNLCAGNFACPWRGAAPLPKPTDSHSTAAYGGKVYLFGGDTSADDHCAGGPCIPFDNSYQDAFEYDPVANVWQPRAPIPVGMSRLDAHTIGDTIYLIADWAVNGDSKGMSNRLLAYDPVADHWTEKKPRPIYREEFGERGCQRQALRDWR